ncbi:MAG: hypothetical protein ACP5UV_00990, partial [Thermoplasmata archaeon]
MTGVIHLNPEDVIKSLIVQSQVYSENPAFYTDIIEGVRKGSVYSDPVKAAISSVLESCINGAIDPWDVDLISFSGIMTSMISGEFTDFYFAGKVMSDAWHVLRIKTLPKMSEEPEEIMETPEEIDHPDEDQPITLELVPAVKHYETRKYMLIELLDSLK